jgi:hypothetical protein
MFSDLPSTADIGVHGWRFSCVPTADITALSGASARSTLLRTSFGSVEEIAQYAIDHLRGLAFR